jgi:tetratricopeptide (TPR) repeat protein
LLAQAVEAFKLALQVYTRDQFPQYWAVTQNNLGNVLMDQGVRTAGQKGNDLLGQAVKAYKQALQVRTREQLPQDWAMTQNNLDAVLKVLGERTSAQKVLRDPQ